MINTIKCLPKAVTACQRRRDNFSTHMNVNGAPRRRISACSIQELLAVIETLRAEVDSLKLSLGRERRV